MLNLIYPLAAAVALLIIGVHLNKNYGYDAGFIRFSIGLFVMCAIAVHFILLSYDPTIVAYEGQIASVGSEGVIVTYSDEYGEAKKVKLLV